ncbi:MAG: DUF4012 domain-containing protein [Candidatus Colwellbacteria bacterium]|nr:DUF4012 domain-containing protein [Candidatus Colwellbacteria bacterium]
MEKPNFKKRINSTLHDVKPVRPIRPQAVEQSSLRGKQAQDKAVRSPRVEGKELKKPLLAVFVVALALIALVFGARFLLQDKLGSGIAASDFPQTFSELKDLIGALMGISSDINTLKAEGFNFAFNGKGEELITTLKSLQANVSKLDALRASFLVQSNLSTASDGLDALIALLDKPGEQRFLVLFLNPSEMRPIGGFAGSYGEVVLTRGSVKEIKVSDIYYPDRFLTKKIVPPTHLQTVTVDWGARDAAWFFDFPTSAQKTIELLEASDIYAKEGVKFDGVVALNVKVIEDLLEITGPVKLPEYGLTLTKDNFLEEIQREVEVGRDKKPGENPKRVLGALTPLLTSRLNELNDSDKNALAFAFLARAINKDIQFYFNESKAEDFARKIGWAGEVANLPESGDYLAVVNVNVAGGKTDARVNQAIKLKSEIDSTGRVNNHLTVSRRHLGRSDEASWYRAQNQNFIKIFTMPDAELVSLKGSTPKNVHPQINYSIADYSVDPVLESIERTRKDITKYSTETYLESGKNVFATWFSILPGESKTLEMDYKSTQLSLADGVRYRVIIDKQSGVESKLEYEIAAPLGFRWQESNGSTFVYKSDTIPARLILELTLVKE